jgi:hypothetical protein
MNMGILEQMAADIAEIKAALAGGAAPAAAASGDKPETAAQKKAREKKEAEAAKPSFTAEQLRDKFLEVQQTHGNAAAKELIKSQGHEKLANLIADAANWQKYWDAAEARLAEEPEGDDNGGL